MQYSISELEQLTGISTHNIRIWERRYKALEPARSAGNTRTYNDDQLKRLLNIASLHHAGVKISKACAMDNAAMEAALLQAGEQTAAIENKYEFYISELIRNGLEYREANVNNLLHNSFKQLGVVEAYKFVFYPLLVRLGLLWRQDSLCPSQEHFLSSILRQKLFAAIDGLPVNESPQGGWLLFLPEDEDHDIGLLMANYLLRVASACVIYLGPKVPLHAVKNTVEGTSPQNLLLFMTRMRPLPDAKEYIEQLSKQFPQLNIYLSGNERLIAGLNLPANVHWVQGVYEFIDAFATVN